MDFSQITKAIMAQKENKGKSMFRQAAVVNRPTGKLEKHKQEKFGAFTWVLPKQYQIPFNPINPTDPSYSSDNYFVVTGLPSEFIKAMKQGMRENKELHEFYARILNKSVEEYDITADEVTEDDFKIFNQFWYPVRPSKTVQKYTLSAFAPYGTERASLVEFDENGDCTSPELLSWQLLQLEQAIVNEKQAEYMLTNNKKDYTTLSADDKKNLSAIRDSRQISYPYDSGVMMMYEFEGDSETEVLKAISSKETAEEHLKYINCGGDFMKKILKRKGKKADKHVDYIQLWVTYGDGKATSDKSADLALSDSREYGEVDEDKNVFEQAPDMESQIIDSIKVGADGTYVALCNRYVHKFKNIADKALLEAYHDRVPEIKKYITDKIYNEFIGVIEKANLRVANELHELNAQGKLPKSFIEMENVDPLVLEGDSSVDTESANEAEASARDVEMEGDTMEELMDGVVED